MLNRAGVIGYPALHSLSPAIHRAGYSQFGLDWEYEAFEVAPSDLASFIETRASERAWRALSVTAPHKEAILDYGEPDEPTQLLGAGNTLVFGRDSKVYNTDVPGFVRALRAHTMATPKSVAIVGNGATARSALLALASLGTIRADVIVRSTARAAALSQLAEGIGVTVELRSADEPFERVDLLVNTIPVAATAAHAVAWAAAASAVMDVVYDPWPTPLGQAAAELGKPALSGLDLLAGQAVDQFYLMTGHRPTFEQCRSAAEQELKRRAAL